MRKLLLTLVAALSLTSFVFAQDVEFQQAGCEGACADACQPIGASCRYFSAYGGYNGLQDYVGEDGVTQTGTFNGGYILGSAVGRQLGGGRRVELDSAFRYNSGDTWTRFGTVPFDGRVRNYSWMVNLVQDFGQGGMVRPYVGGGIGVAYTDGVFDAAGTTFDTTSAAFAYQAMAGASFGKRPGMEFFSEYRFYGNTNVPLENVPAMTTTDFTYLSHSALFGVRIRR